MNYGPTAHQTMEQQVLPEISMEETIHLAETLFFCLTHYVTSAIKGFLSRKRLLSRRTIDYDYAIMLKTISHKCRRNKNFLKIPLSNKTITNAISSRNEICHFDLKALTTNWKRHLSTWKRLCRSVGDEDAALDVQVVFNRMSKGRYQRVIGDKPFYVTIGNYDESAAFGLSLILYSCLSRHMAFSLRSFLTSEKYQPPSTGFDVFKNFKKIIEEEETDLNYLGKGAAQRNDSELLKVAMSARHSTCHGIFSEVFEKWEVYLKSWIGLADIINANEASRKMQGVLDTLIMSQQHCLRIQPTTILTPLKN